MRWLSVLTAAAATACAALSTDPPSSQHVFSLASLPSSAYSPTHVHSTIELGGSLTRSVATYSLVKDDQSATKGDVFVVGVKRGGNQGGWIEAFEGKGGAKKPVDMVAVGGDDDTTYYSITLTPPPSGQKATLTVSAVLAHQAVPNPPSLPQNAETIFMLWEGDLLAPLTGLSKAQKEKVEQVVVKVKTPTPRIHQAQSQEGFEMNHSQGAALVTFTSKGSVVEYEQQIARVHYQQPSAVALIRKLDRIVEISHWGSNLAVQEDIDLANTGPTLEGNFARIDFQKATMHRRQNFLAISSLSLPLPSSAHNPYYYDLVGNVSTSRFRPSHRAQALLPSQKKLRSLHPALLELTPRYPLMGGWNYSFTIGYDLDAREYVRARKEVDGQQRKYIAAVPFVEPLKDVAVDEVRVEIRLPEGARNILVHPPFPIDSISYPAFVPSLFGASSVPRPGNEGGTVVKTYLDSTGRPTVVLKKRGVTDRHGGEVIIEYDLPSFAQYLQKPLACASALFAVFLAVSVAKRVRWGIA
ncbi:hypothetical protein JCM8547_007484 [Rhodosporidiobolus lusitaniae]